MRISIINQKNIWHITPQFFLSNLILSSSIICRMSYLVNMVSNLEAYCTLRYLILPDLILQYLTLPSLILPSLNLSSFILSHLHRTFAFCTKSCHVYIQKVTT